MRQIIISTERKRFGAGRRDTPALRPGYYTITLLVMNLLTGDVESFSSPAVAGAGLRVSGIAPPFGCRAITGFLLEYRGRAGYNAGG